MCDPANAISWCVTPTNVISWCVTHTNDISLWVTPTNDTSWCLTPYQWDQLTCVTPTNDTSWHVWPLTQRYQPMTRCHNKICFHINASHNLCYFILWSLSKDVHQPYFWRQRAQCNTRLSILKLNNKKTKHLYYLNRNIIIFIVTRHITLYQM